MTGMNWATVIATGVVTTLIALLFNGAAWFLFRRQIERQDSTIASLLRDLRDLRERRMRDVEEKLEDICPRVTQCEATQVGIDRRLQQGAADFRAIRDDISLMRASVEGVSREIKLVLGSMKLVGK